MNADRTTDPCGSDSIENMLLRVLVRRRRVKTDAVSLRGAVPQSHDPETLHAETTAASTQIACEEAVHVRLEEILRQLNADAASEAEEVARWLRQTADQLRALGCVTPQQIDQFVEAREDVLLKMYRELQKPRPSPTRLRQLAAQYALDPRRCIGDPSHHIDVRRSDEGVVVAVVPAGVGRLRSLPLPGTTVQDLFAAQLLEYVTASEPYYSAAMEAIEIQLGYVPEVAALAAATSSMNSPQPAVSVDPTASCVTARGRTYRLDGELVQIFQGLLDAKGNWVSSRELEELPLLAGARIDRLLKRLPPELRELIEGRSGKGYRLRMERLRPISSVVVPAPNGNDP